MKYLDKKTSKIVCSLAALVAAATLTLGVNNAQAQAYPNKPVKFILPYPPGGSTDLAGRLLASELSTSLGQQYVVENRAGAAGNIGVEAIAKSAADGYTIGFSGMGPSVLTHIAGPKPPFSQKELTFIGHAGIVEMMIVSNISSPYATTKQIIDAAKANPGKISYGHGGTGSPAHLSWELFNSMAGVNIAAIPYKGDGPAMIDIMGGQVPFGSISVAGAISQVKAGRVRPVAVYSPQRSPSLPDVPTVAETGLTGFEAGTFNILIGPGGMAAPVVQRLNSVLNESMAKSAVREKYLQMGMVPVINTPPQTMDFVARETAKWAKVIKEANIQMQ